MSDDGRGTRRCELCGDPTTEGVIPLKHSSADALSGASAVELLACEDCQRRLLEKLEARWGDNFDKIERIEDASGGNLTETIEEELEGRDNDSE